MGQGAEGFTVTIKHKIKFILWSLVTAIVMTNDRMRFEYNADCEQAWKQDHTALGSNEWLHRRWFPKKYENEKVLDLRG